MHPLLPHPPPLPPHPHIQGIQITLVIPHQQQRPRARPCCCGGEEGEAGGGGAGAREACFARTGGGGGGQGIPQRHAPATIAVTRHEELQEGAVGGVSGRRSKGEEDHARVCGLRVQGKMEGGEEGTTGICSHTISRSTCSTLQAGHLTSQGVNPHLQLVHCTQPSSERLVSLNTNI